MSTVLIIEDDLAISRALMINLRAREYRAEHAATGAQALKIVSELPVDCVLLDLGLPDMSGLTVIDGIRGWSQVPIIVISARHEVQSKIEALDRGADDFITKPFAVGEVLARLRAALRRSVHPEQTGVLTSSDGRLIIDLSARQVRVDGEHVKLTPHEWDMVRVLAQHPERLISRTELLKEVWGEGYARETNYLRVYMSQIRQKLEVDSSHPRYFTTEPGMGYRLTLGEPETGG